jgi:hypothetical protein
MDRCDSPIDELEELFKLAPKEYKDQFIQDFQANERIELENKYPFKEGEEYFVIEDGEIIPCTWDFVSEEIYDKNPLINYYHSYEQAKRFLKNKIK